MNSPGFPEKILGALQNVFLQRALKYFRHLPEIFLIKREGQA
jgi:hypothetical protein